MFAFEAKAVLFYPPRLLLFQLLLQLFTRLSGELLFFLSFSLSLFLFLVRGLSLLSLFQSFLSCLFSSSSCFF